jgi:acyl-CoA thioester hydrolase
MSLKPNPTTVEARQPVIYGDTDQMGVVYYANYFRFFELGRMEYFRARGGKYSDIEAAGFALPVVHAEADYRASAKYEDVVLIRTTVNELRRASFGFEYEVCRESDGLLLCTGSTIHACLAKTGRPTQLPPQLSRLLAA